MTEENGNNEKSPDFGNDTINYSGTDDTQDLKSMLRRIENRIDCLETRFLQSKPSESSSLFPEPPSSFGHLPRTRAEDCVPPHQAKENPFGPENPLTAESPELDEIQEKFNAIKNSLDKVILPSSFRLHDSRTGIKREDQQTLNVISKCGRYVETLFKLLSQSKENQPLDIEPILTTLTANIRYLQDEYSALLVKGKFDDSTAQLFRSLQKGNSGFDTQSINNVRIAAELSSIAARNTQSQRGTFRSTYRSQANSSPQYSGYYNPKFGSGRYYRERREDLFHNLQGPRFRTPNKGPPWHKDQDSF